MASAKNEASEATINENSDRPEWTVYHKIRTKTFSHPPKNRENDTNITEGTPFNENDAKNPSNVGMKSSCPKYLKVMIETKI